jgi:hypothetical protein
MVSLLQDHHGLVDSGRFNDTIAAVAKELHDGHTDQYIAVEDDDGLDLGRFAVAVDASCALRDGSWRGRK